MVAKPAKDLKGFKKALIANKCDVSEAIKEITPPTTKRYLEVKKSRWMQDPEVLKVIAESWHKYSMSVENQKKLSEVRLTHAIADDDTKVSALPALIQTLGKLSGFMNGEDEQVQITINSMPNAEVLLNKRRQLLTDKELTQVIDVSSSKGSVNPKQLQYEQPQEVDVTKDSTTSDNKGYVNYSIQDIDVHPSTPQDVGVVDSVNDKKKSDESGVSTPLPTPLNSYKATHEISPTFENGKECKKLDTDKVDMDMDKAGVNMNRENINKLNINKVSTE